MPNHCLCEAAYLPACGVDGNTYDAACGTDCVPVEIECEGACPCAGCGCQVVDGNACDSRERQWICDGQGFDPQAFDAEGCESLPTGSIRYCCDLEVAPDAFCF